MIIFSWTITPNQIRALKCVAAHQQRAEYAEKHRKNLKLEENPLDTQNLRNWSTATQYLLRENFIFHTEREPYKWEIQNGYKRQVWGITEKGELLLKLVALEIEEQAHLISENRKQLKLLAA